MLRLSLGLAMALVVMGGCAPGEDEIVYQANESVDSWSKTLEMLCAQWAEYRVPTLYVKQTMKAGEQALAKQLEEVEKYRDEKARAAEGKIHRLRFWIEQNQEKLGAADGTKRREILRALPGKGAP